MTKITNIVRKIIKGVNFIIENNIQYTAKIYHTNNSKKLTMFEFSYIFQQID